MTRELRYLESEFAFVKPEKFEEKEKAGEDLVSISSNLFYVTKKLDHFENDYTIFLIYKMVELFVLG